MTPGTGLPGRDWLLPIAWLVLGLAAGCAGRRSHLDQALQKDHLSDHQTILSAEYTIACPDVLKLVITGGPEVTSPQQVGPDGRIDLGEWGRLRIEGKTASEATRAMAAELDLPPDRVQVQVVEYNSQKVYLIGEGSELQRAVAYRGPETVCDLLKRAGGIKPGAAPDEVFVVRSRVTEGRQPEVLQVKLTDILLRQDDKTNIRLQPFDQVFIGETNQAWAGRYVPPWIKPFYQAACGLNRPGQGKPPAPEPPPTRLRPFHWPWQRPPAPPSSDLPEPPQSPEPTPLPLPRRIT